MALPVGLAPTSFPRTTGCFSIQLFQQRTNTSCYLAIPTHGFTVVLSVFGGTPPAKPLNCKIRFAVSGRAILRSWAQHPGDDSKFVLAKFNLSPEDITWMRSEERRVGKECRSRW